MNSSTWTVRCAASILFLAAGSLPAAAGDVAGTWDGVFEMAGQRREYSFELTRDGEAVQGFMVSPRSKNRYPVEEGSIRDSTLRITVKHSQGQVKIEAKLDGDLLEGTCEAAGTGSAKFTARRAAGAPKAEGKAGALRGTWKVTAKADEREMQSDMEIVEKDGKLSGTMRSERGSTDLREPKLQDGKFTARIVLQRSSGEFQIDLEAVFDGPDRLKGTWKTGGDEATGPWEARRAAVPVKLQARYLVEAIQSDGQVFRVFLEPRIDGERLGGAMFLENGEKVELRSGTARDGRFECEVTFPFKGEEMTVKIAGSLQEKGLLEGTWQADGGSGSWTGKPVAEL